MVSLVDQPYYHDNRALTGVVKQVSNLSESIKVLQDLPRFEYG